MDLKALLALALTKSAGIAWISPLPPSLSTLGYAWICLLKRIYVCLCVCVCPKTCLPSVFAARVTRATTAYRTFPSVSFLYVLLSTLLLPLLFFFFCFHLCTLSIYPCVCVCARCVFLGAFERHSNRAFAVPINTHTPCGTVIYLRAVQAFPTHTHAHATLEHMLDISHIYHTGGCPQGSLLNMTIYGTVHVWNFALFFFSINIQ